MLVAGVGVSKEEGEIKEKKIGTNSIVGEIKRVAALIVRGWRRRKRNTGWRKFREEEIQMGKKKYGWKRRRNMNGEEEIQGVVLVEAYERSRVT